MKIVITGAGGFLGRALACSLAAKNHQIVALDNDFRGNLDSIKPSLNIERVRCDILD